MDTQSTAYDHADTDCLPYRHNCVRDLAWAIFSPALVSSVQCNTALVPAARFEMTAARKRFLQALDDNPEPLTAFLRPVQNRFLGIYFEQLWRFFLTHDSETTLLAHNQQFVHEKQTLGELDFLYRCHRRDAIVHLEVAVKFYLGFVVSSPQNLCDDSHWLGPNCADRLDLKLSHLRIHQLALVQHPHVSEILRKRKILPSQQEIAMHGYLYFQQGINGTCDVVSPASASSAHLRSYWIRVHDLRDKLKNLPPEEQAIKRYRLVPRQEWLCAHNLPSPGLLNVDGLLSMIDAEFSAPLRQPVLCERYCERQRAADSRFFIVPWPRKKQ
jgi:uncharacterized protein